MKFVITTTYENVDDEWLDWYLKRLKAAEVTPGSTGCADTVREDGYAEFSSKDPTSAVIATTSYEVING